MSETCQRITLVTDGTETPTVAEQLSESIGRKTLTWKADFVVRYQKGKKIRRMVSGFGTTALTLMSVCPCPLLLVRNATHAVSNNDQSNDKSGSVV